MASVLSRPAAALPRRVVATAIQVAALVLISLIAGTVFGIWRGYDPASWSVATFVNVHQGAVRGLNVLLPATGALSLALTALLAFMARGRRRALALYLLALGLMAVPALVTRFITQPINAEIMLWTADLAPPDWMELRDRWWTWHVVRFFATFAAMLALVAAIFVDRESRSGQA